MTEDDPKVPPGWKLIGGGNPAFQMMIPISQAERRAAKAMSASGACSKASSWKPPFEQLGPNNAQHADTGIQPPHVKGPGTMHQPLQAAQQPPTPDTVPPGPAHTSHSATARPELTQAAQHINAMNNLQPVQFSAPDGAGASDATALASSSASAPGDRPAPGGPAPTHALPPQGTLARPPQGTLTCRSPDRRKARSPDRRKAPDRREAPDHCEAPDRRKAPDRREAPDRCELAPEHREAPDRCELAPEHRELAPEHREAPDLRKPKSPDRKPKSPDRQKQDIWRSDPKPKPPRSVQNTKSATLNTNQAARQQLNTDDHYCLRSIKLKVRGY